MPDEERPYALDIEDRDNLDKEMASFVRGIERRYGFVPNYLKFFKTDNRRLRAFIAPYMELLRADSGISDVEHEMIAVVCAATNGCFYCTTHHGAVLREKTGDVVLAEYLSRNYKLADLSDRHRAMLDYVVKVLTNAEAIDDDDRERMREAGFDDETIWSVTSTACFYSSANRMSQAVGLVPDRPFFDMGRGPKEEAQG